MKKILFIAYLSMGFTSYAQGIQDPIKDRPKANRIYLKWVLDINHTGIEDVLVTEKPTPDELKEAKEENGELFNPSQYGFAVYLGTKPNIGYIKDGGVVVDTECCHVGYIDEIKQYGIVTLEQMEVTAPSGHGLPVPKNQVICYTIEGDHMKKTNLTPLYDINEKNPIYDKYLSDAHRTKVQLKEVTP